jgi:hypothetical protein
MNGKSSQTGPVVVQSSAWGYELMQLQPFERVGVMILSGKGNKKVEQPEVRKQREVLDDFVRNFCMTYGLMKTLEVFEVEWFEMKEKGRVVESQLILVPDEYGRSLQLTNILQHLQEQLEQQNVVARDYEAILENMSL